MCKDKALCSQFFYDTKRGKRGDMSRCWTIKALWHKRSVSLFIFNEIPMFRSRDRLNFLVAATVAASHISR